ncbi:MAG: asparagine synthase (glutamine-hydrolyzing) [Lachnospiraceae bacterium]|nr:asparagine synthase (glutamine-hydrolyzing) [Lachnospiraceae bacterium]
MCGIVGLGGLGKTSDYLKENLEKMKDRMIHRGPDDEGSFFSEDGILGIGFRRLSILDLTLNGRQPMTSHNGRYVITFNGEIYNHRQLRDKMLADEKLNVRESDFKSTCDTEILLEAISNYGVREAISLCRGMFGIAVYDKEEKKLYLIRDRIGEKPIYYGWVKDTFVFASEIGSIAAIEGFENGINREILDMYFILGYIPQPYSIYENIYKLKPGCILEIESPFNKEPKITPYWDMHEVALRGQNNLFKGSFTEAADELERLLKDVIRDQMIADVPLGAFLSAGIDSSTTVALMQSLGGKKVRSFTIGMDVPGFNEAEYAKQIAAHLGTEHTELYITEKDAKDVIPKLSYMFGEPYADSSQIPTYLVSRMTKEHVTVSLSGDGGDELFCGYTVYFNIERIWKEIRYIPLGLRKLLSNLVLSSPLKKSEAFRIRSALLAARGPEDLYNISRENDRIIRKVALGKTDAKCANDLYEPGFIPESNHNLMLMDMDLYLPDDILTKVDRTAMSVSLETRIPMLDRDVVEFVWSLPIDYLKQGQTGKRILREILYRHVPKEMMERPKTGFAIPIDRWLMTKELRGWAESLLDRDLVRSQGVLDPDIVWFLWEDFTERGIWRYQLWYILMFQQWMTDIYTKRA